LNHSSETTQNNEQIHQTAPAKKVPETAPVTAQPAEQSASATNVELVNETILKDKVPENASLAKEKLLS
jgi:hypothetical protein